MGVFSHDEAFYYYGLTDREPLVHTLTIYSGYNVHRLKEDGYKVYGYRNIPDCEDYDFICRAIQSGFKLGNVDKTVLQYRIRKDSISNRNRAKQYLIRNYISKHRRKYLSEKEIQSYINSVAFKKDLLQYKKFQEMKKKLKEKGTIVSAIELLKNKYTYKLFSEKIGLKIRDNM